MPDPLALVFLACTTVGGQERCQEVSILWDRSAMACMLLGQAEMARWFDQHPLWYQRGGWRCVRGRQT